MTVHQIFFQSLFENQKKKKINNYFCNSTKIWKLNLQLNLKEMYYQQNIN